MCRYNNATVHDLIVTDLHHMTPHDPTPFPTLSYSFVVLATYMTRNDFMWQCLTLCEYHDLRYLFVTLHDHI